MPQCRHPWFSCWTLLYVGVTTLLQERHRLSQGVLLSVYGSRGTRPAARMTARTTSSASLRVFLRLAGQPVQGRPYRRVWPRSGVMIRPQSMHRHFHGAWIPG